MYEAFERLEKTSWCTLQRNRSSRERRLRTCRPGGAPGKYVGIPVDLAEERVAGKTGGKLAVDGTLRPSAVVCFGILQALPGYVAGFGGGCKGGSGAFRWAELSALSGIHVKTLKRAVRSLADAGWLAINQKNRLAPIEFVLQHPDEAWKKGVASRLRQGAYKGETLMGEFLSLIGLPREFVAGGVSGLLVNPRTQQHLQFDRYYPLHRVAFEFNGKQHYEPTEMYSREQVAAQRERDAMKRSICAEKNITLVVVHAHDLSLEGMLRKVGDLLPRRDLRKFPQTIRYLEHMAGRYRRAAHAG